MIPQQYITEWSEIALWQATEQVEQDLIISRSLVELFSDEFIAEKVAFRGGRALHKLFLEPTQTTDVYARADSKQKREALEKAYVNLVPGKASQAEWERNHNLLGWLKSLTHKPEVKTNSTFNSMLLSLRLTLQRQSIG